MYMVWDKGDKGDKRYRAAATEGIKGGDNRINGGDNPLTCLEVTQEIRMRRFCYMRTTG